MGAIANFQKRRAAERAKQANVASTKTQVSQTKAPENEALALLASLIGVKTENAIEAAKELAEKEYVVVDQAQLVELQKALDESHFESAELLGLLTDLLGCEEENAIEQAKQLVEKGAYIAGLTEEQLGEVHMQISLDPAKEEFKGVATSLKAEGQIESITELAKKTATDLEQSAGAVEGAADAVTGAAADLEDTASQLAYSADSIGQATAELQEATKALKKPSAAPASSRGNSSARRKNNSNK